MSTAGSTRSSQLRHALRTPLNQISGYTEMLVEDLAADAPAAVREALEAIRVSCRAILELLRDELPAGELSLSAEHLQALRTQLQAPLQVITTQVGLLAADGHARHSGLNLADVLRIGSAVAELVEFSTGNREVPEAAEPAGSHRIEAVTAASGDILVVDDNPGNRDLLTRMLERHGYAVWNAESGQMALTAIAGRQFDLILLDLMMPGMDGIEVLRRIKGDPRWSALPVIMLSALDETSRVIQCLEFGAEDYVVKPFDPVLLLARLRSTLERSRLRAAETTRARELEIAYTRLSENEQRLQESEERLRLATDAAEVGIWYYYPASERVLMTPGCKRLFGFEENDDALTYDQVLKRIHPEDRNRADAVARTALANESDYDIEYRVECPDGSVRWLSLRGTAQEHGQARELRLAGVALDITTRKRAEEAVLQTHKLESIGLLAGGIAHDFNNLLTGIIGSASFVLDNLGEEDPSTEMLRNVVNAGERAADLTRQLLAYSGKGKFTVQKLDISKLVGDIAVLLRTSISRAVTLERRLDPDLPKVEGDSTQIQQIVMNLVINGSEAIHGEGVVRVATGVTRLEAGGREDFVLAGDIAPGEYIFLEVTDTGSGMDREHLPKIFEPFYTTKFTGRGLGLAAVFGIVRGHDGALQVQTAPGAGSTFRVYFPPASGEAVRRKTDTAGSIVLFVDEEAVVRNLGKIALEHAGYRVLAAESGEQALRILKEHIGGIPVAVLDLTMRGWSGIETYYRIKQIDPALQVIVSSGYSEQEMRSKYPGQKLAGFLHKPYGASDLVARVKDLLRNN